MLAVVRSDPDQLLRATCARWLPGRATPENLCSVMIRVEKGRFVPRDGDNYYCPSRS